MQEQRVRYKQIKYEVEHNLRPKIWFLYFPINFYGLKKDKEAFVNELREIVEDLMAKHNLVTNAKKFKRVGSCPDGSAVSSGG